MMPTIPEPDLTLFLGRLHPMLVHLPIGFLFLLATFDILSRFRRFKALGQARGPILVMALATSVVSASCGWMLAGGGGYDAELLARHRWAGTAVAGGVLLTLLAHRQGLGPLYHIFLVATLAAIAFAGHEGAAMTHGRGYLAQYAPAPLRGLLRGEKSNANGRPTNIDEALVFAHVVQPILHDRCADCHGASKANGGLRIDSLGAMLRGGQSGPAIESGSSTKSRLLRRVQLPLKEEGHMPPAGRPQPSSDEIAILSWWIDAGAPTDKTIATLKPTPAVFRALETLFGSPEPETPPRDLAAIQPTIEKLRAELGISIRPVARDQPWLDCSASMNSSFGDDGLAKLAPLSANIRWLDLGGTRVTSAGLKCIAGARNITRLHLERTAITDAGLVHLAKSRHLEYLNLYGTRVGDGGLVHLARLGKLQKVYLWQTGVSAEAAKAFSSNLTDQQQIRRWHEEIDDIRAKIDAATVEINIGGKLAPEPPQVAPKRLVAGKGPVDTNATKPKTTGVANGTSVPPARGTVPPLPAKIADEPRPD